MKYLFLFIFLSLQAHAFEEVRLLAKVQGQNLTLLNGGEPFETHYEDQTIQKLVNSLKDGEEILLIGRFDFSHVPLEGGGKPIFLLQDARPVSLSKLGLNLVALPEANVKLLEERSYSPQTLPVSSEVFSSITLTTTFLLMHSLTSEGGPAVTQEIQRGLILSAGLLATGVLIYEQISGKTSVLK